MARIIGRGGQSCGDGTYPDSRLENQGSEVVQPRGKGGFSGNVFNGGPETLFRLDTIKAFPVISTEFGYFTPAYPLVVGVVREKITECWVARAAWIGPVGSAD
jgi:hypothetical protein